MICGPPMLSQPALSQPALSQPALSQPGAATPELRPARSRAPAVGCCQGDEPPDGPKLAPRPEPALSWRFAGRRAVAMARCPQCGRVAESSDAVRYACFACGHEWSAPRAVTMAVPGVGDSAAGKSPSPASGFNPTPARAAPVRAPTPRAMPAPAQLPRPHSGGPGVAVGGPASMVGLGPSVPTSGFANLGPRIAGASEPRRPANPDGGFGLATTGQFLTSMPPPMPPTLAAN